MDSEFFLSQYERTLESFIAQHYPHKSNPMNEAIAYALRGPGKKVRAQLVYQVCAFLGGEASRSLLPALAVEMIHTYSLVHDDLPCLDNDHMRRGRATVHVVFGADMATLVGDALLTDAFSLIADESMRFADRDDHYHVASRLAMIDVLSRAAGGRGMVAGQALDVYWTKRSGAGQSELDQIHELKTGCLLGASAALGAIAANAPKQLVDQLFQLGCRVGVAFQICDDLLDDDPSSGKSAGKDKEQGKLTYLAMMDRESARTHANRLTNDALAILSSISPVSTSSLHRFISELLHRKR
jgi:geranylgeranyl diphosphate synthase type II